MKAIRFPSGDSDGENAAISPALPSGNDCPPNWQLG
jgi:hypothetical protein